MVQGFYSLDEAARYLGMAPEDLSQMAQRREIRAFADRGTWRFRTQDVEELGRKLGKGSSPDLQLGDAPRPKPHDSPAPKSSDPSDSSVFTFSLGSEDEEVQLGTEQAGKSGKSGRSPSPKPGSDSDVRLVSEGSDVDFKVKPESGAKSSKSKGLPTHGPDSGVRLVGEGKSKSDSDVKIVPDHGPEDSAVPLGDQPPRRGSDSDIRLEEALGPSRGRSDDSLLTEEIDLDAEMKAAEEAAAKKGKGKSKPSVPTAPAAGASPFELSDSDLEDPKAKAGKKTSSPDSSSDLELTPGDQSPISLSSSDEVPALQDSSSDDVVDLDSATKTKAVGGKGDSGINLDKPADSGISLESADDGSDEIEFELSLDAHSTPKPAPVTQEDDSSSEFELTLDDSGGLAPIESDHGAASDSGEKDIFETDFEVPALEDESGSQAVALDESDTDLESSDFDLALGDEDASGTDEESGSQVVVLDEEEADEGAATVARSARRPAKGAAALDVDSDEDVGVLDEEEAVAEEEEEIPTRRAPAAAADWGYMPALVLAPCAIVLLLVGMMGFELLHSMWGYHQPGKVSGPIVRSLSDMFGAELPKD
jgi:excisionase family DNA binding protein